MNVKNKSIIVSIAETLEYPENVLTENNVDRHIVCDTLSLSHGLPGLCMLFGKLMEYCPNEAERWAGIGKRHLGIVVNEINNNGINDMSLFSGLAGVGLAAVCLSNGFRDYRNLINTINRVLCNWIEKTNRVIDFRSGTHAVVYDVIAGMSGIISYMSLFKADNECYDGLSHGIDMLIRLADDICVFNKSVPGWYIPASNQFTDFERKRYPKGNFNTGLSHGISGPLAVLSQTALNGFIRPGQIEAIKKMVDFLMTYKNNHNGRVIWNSQLDFEQVANGMQAPTDKFYRDAWCYGVPGICYTLLCAAQATDDKSLAAFSIDTLCTAVNDIQGIFSPTICHGYTGICQLLDGAERLVGKNCFASEKEMIVKEILDFYDEKHKYGFCDIDYDVEKGSNVSYDVCGFLNGAAGVALGLCSLENNKNNTWQRALMIV